MAGQAVHMAGVCPLQASRGRHRPQQAWRSDWQALASSLPILQPKGVSLRSLLFQGLALR